MFFKLIWNKRYFIILEIGLEEIAVELGKNLKNQDHLLMI